MKLNNSAKTYTKSLIIVLILGVVLGLIASLFLEKRSLIGEKTSSQNTSAVTVNGFPTSFADLVDNVSPAVVNISSTKIVKVPDFFKDFYSPFEDFFGKDFRERFFGRQPRNRKEKSLGSGFIVSKKGYILTNTHVIAGADEISIRLSNGKTYDAKVIARDKKIDLALIKAKSWLDLPDPVIFGDSDNLRVGDWVMAIGNPFGLDHTVTAGIVSAKGRVIGSGPNDDFIQTDASINPGNSGGPLFNIRGEVVGINTAIFSTSGGNIGIGFAVPINMAKEIIHGLSKEESVSQGWIGIEIQKLTSELARNFGLKETNGTLITDVSPGGPADDAGMQRGDVIIGFNGKKIKNENDLSKIVSGASIESFVDVDIIRGGKKKTLSVRVGNIDERYKDRAEKKLPDFGMEVEKITSETAQYLGYKPDESGVVITGIKPGGWADEAGLKLADIIKEINRKPIKSVEDYRNSIKDVSLSKGVLFFVLRKNSPFYLVIKGNNNTES